MGETVLWFWNWSSLRSRPGHLLEVSRGERVLYIMKTLFKSNEIAHIWAHKSAPEGKSPGAMSFRGDSFYSYGTVIARHITHKGKPAIVLNDNSFSNTTARHEGKVRSAIHGLNIPIFHISKGMGTSLDVTGKELFEYVVENSARWLSKAERAKGRKGDFESHAARCLEDAKAINEFFGLRRKVDENTIARLKESSAKAEREANALRKLAEENRRKEEQQYYDAWVSGESVTASGFNPRLFPVAFRIEGEELVSTLGARVPLDDAKRALAFVLMKKSEGWSRNGVTMRVGHYQIDTIGGDGVVAGCHRITWDEISRLEAILS